MTKQRRIRKEVSDDAVLTIGKGLAEEIGEGEIQVIKTLENNEKENMSMKEIFKEGGFEDQTTLEDNLVKLVNMNVLSIDKEDEFLNSKFGFVHDTVLVVLH